MPHLKTMDGLHKHSIVYLVHYKFVTNYNGSYSWTHLMARKVYTRVNSRNVTNIFRKLFRNFNECKTTSFITFKGGEI